MKKTVLKDDNGNNIKCKMRLKRENEEDRIHIEHFLKTAIPILAFCKIMSICD